MKNTLILTDEEIQVVLSALGIAENTCIDTYNSILSKIVLRRGSNEMPMEKSNAEYYFNKSAVFAELNEEIQKRLC